MTHYDYKFYVLTENKTSAYMSTPFKHFWPSPYLLSSFPISSSLSLSPLYVFHSLSLNLALSFFYFNFELHPSFAIYLFLSLSVTQNVLIGSESNKVVTLEWTLRETNQSKPKFGTDNILSPG